MHDALQIREILEAICDFCDTITLSRLIRTCRAFEEPSRIVLWEILVSLTPVLKLFPDVEDKNLKVDEMINRMRLYTSQVVIIFLQPGPLDSSFDPQIKFMHGHMLPDDMFPKLRQIHSGLLFSKQTIPIFRWVQGPSVIRFRMEIPCIVNDTTELEFISALDTLCPNATTAHVCASPSYVARGGVMPNLPLDQSLSKAIRGWTRLVDASFCGVDAAAYTHLSRLESLTSLALTLQPNSVQCHQQANLPPKPYPALKALAIRSNGVSQLSEWLKCLPHGVSFSLDKLFFTAFDFRPRSEGESHTLSNTIAATFCHRSLEHISLATVQMTALPVHDVSWMRPLFAFNRLSSLDLTWFCATSINDDGLRELASSFPLLQRLYLNETVPFGESNGAVVPTFKGFFSLIVKCPRLQELSIVLDMRESMWVVSGEVCNRTMTKLALGNSLVNDRQRVMMILKAVFPLLTSFSYGDTPVSMI